MVFYQVKGRGSYGHGRTWKESYQREVWKVLPDSGERKRQTNPQTTSVSDSLTLTVLQRPFHKHERDIAKTFQKLKNMILNTNDRNVFRVFCPILI